MQVTQIRIHNWRNFEDFELEVPRNAGLVCLVGENGTGKSNILELLSYAASRLGLAPGPNFPRGNPGNEPHSVEVTVQFPQDGFYGREGVLNVSPIEGDLISPELTAWPEPRIPQNQCELLIEETQLAAGEKDQIHDEWSGELRLTSESDGENTEVSHTLEGVNGDMREAGGHQVYLVLNQKENFHHLWLDASRAYPPKVVNRREFGQAMERDWDELTLRRQDAVNTSSQKYERWIKYAVGKELSQAAEDRSQARARLREDPDADPQVEFTESLPGYEAALREVMPHLKFAGVDVDDGTLKFEVVGEEINFNRLSGGEKEIGFLIGQIKRFNLTHGLLLLDEPELHLNPDLIRRWVRFLEDCIHSGQVWLATQSMEAVEAAGRTRSLLLSRSTPEGVVSESVPLSERPALSVLSRALGNPAFSIRSLRFVWIEGEPDTWERERFNRLCGELSINRFVEGENCDQVIRKVDTLERIADETGEHLAVGGVVDRDFRTEEDIEEITADRTLHVLGCHEIENVFLHPSSLQELLNELDGDDSARNLVLDLSDGHAPRWVVKRTLARLGYPTRHEWGIGEEESRNLKVEAADLDGWEEIEGDFQTFAEDLSQAVNLNDPVKTEFQDKVVEHCERYDELRSGDELWKYCLGKEVLGEIVNPMGYASKQVLEKRLVRLWEEGDVDPPEELEELRGFVEGIDPDEP